jgi:hypothetical protein
MSDKLLDGGSTQLGASETLPALVSPKQRKQEDSAVLKLKGLPYTASSHQIYDFFAGFNVNEVAFVYEPDGRPSGLVSRRRLRSLRPVKRKRDAQDG